MTPELKLMRRLVKEARARLRASKRVGRRDGEVYAYRVTLRSLQATARRLVEPFEPYRCVCGLRTERHRGETGDALWCPQCKERMKL